jgi:hypothetical protein
MAWRVISYQESPKAMTIFSVCMALPQLVVMQDETLELACLFSVTPRIGKQMPSLDIPVRFENRCEKKDDGQMRMELCRCQSMATSPTVRSHSL